LFSKNMASIRKQQTTRMRGEEKPSWAKEISSLSEKEAKRWTSARERNGGLYLERKGNKGK